MQNSVETLPPGAEPDLPERSRRIVGQRAVAGQKDKNAQPSVSVERANGRIVSISVRCACGKQTTIACQYEEGDV